MRFLKNPEWVQWKHCDSSSEHFEGDNIGTDDWIEDKEEFET